MKRLFDVFLKAKNEKKEKERRQVDERLVFAVTHPVERVFETLESSREGLTESTVDKNREIYGSNEVAMERQETWFEKIVEAFVNPFSIVLFVLAGVSAVTDVILAPVGEKDPTTVIIITVMVLISGVLRLVQETRSGDAAAKLSEMIETTTAVTRMGMGMKELPIDEVVVGDIITLSAGDMIPADLRIIGSKDLFISQSQLTGESEPVEKHTGVESDDKPLLEATNLAFMGSAVLSGSATGIVVATGNDTMLGEMAEALSIEAPPTDFEKGVNAVSWILIRFMLVMVPIVFFINGFTKSDWLHALLFAISIAVGLTPEMLPMIVTTCLAKGAVAMSKEKVIIKDLNAIQNLGSIDILCTDKTGTLTLDKVVLQHHLDIHGVEDERVLRHGYLNSYFQTGLKNMMDVAIIDETDRQRELNESRWGIKERYRKVDEIPFDFERRRMSVVVADDTGKTQMITKGAIEEMLKISTFAEYGGKVLPLTDDIREVILDKVGELNDGGMRVIGVAQKTNPSPVGEFSVEDEADMVLIGYLAFLDPPKETTAEAISALHQYGVDVKILTGDNDRVAVAICKQVGLDVRHVVLGEDVAVMDDDELAKVAEKTTVFAKLSPVEKARVVRVLRENGHSVGYMGDGINDAAAMKASDVGISVDTAVDIAKESADVILLEKDLMVLEKGILEGRKTYGNMIKYIKMTASSNFGNMFAVLAASAFLPFLPMESIHLILLNLIYDLSCTAIPWDNVDPEMVAAPKKWSASSVSTFMIWFGPVSSIFDIATYLVMYFVICPGFFGGQSYAQLTDPVMREQFIAIFQSGWFIESMWSQTLVIHMLRTAKIPFVQSRASAVVTAFTLTGIGVLTVIPFTSFGVSLGLTALPLEYFGYLAVILTGYMVLTTVVKKYYNEKYHEFL